MVYPLSSSSSCYYSYECSYTEIKALSTFKNSRKKLTYKQNKILHFAASHRNIFRSDLSSGKFPYSKKPIERGNAKKDLRNLWEMKLLDRFDKGKEDDKQKKETRYKLSKYGIYNLITNNGTLPFEIAKNLLKYNDHILFRFFLFPYVKLETLSKVDDSYVFSQIFSYLHDCCKQLEEMISNINDTPNQKDGYSIQQLFIWDNVPKEFSDTENLRTFLKLKLNWDWLDRAHIRKIDDQNSIEVSYEMNRIFIIMDKQRGKATLSYKGKKQYEFIVKELPDGHFTVSYMHKSLEELYLKTFLLGHIVNIPKFIVSLLSDNNPNYPFPIMEILGQDERFVQALRKTKNLFDKRCKLILEKSS